MNNNKKDKIKESIKKKITAYSSMVFLSIGLLIISQRSSISSLYKNPEQADFMQGFIVGMVIVIEIIYMNLLFITIYSIYRYLCKQKI